MYNIPTQVYLNTSVMTGVSDSWLNYTTAVTANSVAYIFNGTTYDATTSSTYTKNYYKVTLYG